MDSLGLRYTPAEVAEFQARPEPRDVRTDRGRLRLISAVISPRSGEAYLVQVGELLDTVDRTLAGFDQWLWLRILAGLVAAALIGRWLFSALKVSIGINFWVDAILTATIGAVVLLFILRLIRR
jgi:uncharacterized membrane protein YeaQ/YmgE (transglycosylase-associated protein family)